MGISDDLWTRIKPLIPITRRPPDKAYRRRQGGGRKPRDQREVFDAVLHVLQTRCAWHELPEALGSVSTVNRHFRHWEQAGLFQSIWSAGLAEHPELLGIHWTCEPHEATTRHAGLPVTRWRPVHGGRRGRPRKPAAPARAPAPSWNGTPGDDGTAAKPADALARALRAFISRRD